MNAHAKCWRHYRVRPPDRAAEPTATEGNSCIYDKLHKGYGYTQAWIDFLVEQLSDPEIYKDALGADPVAI